MFLFEKIDKNVQINSLFLGNSEIFYLCPRNLGDFFIWGVKKVDCQKECTLYGFRFRDVWKGSIYLTNGIKCACLSEQSIHFKAWPVYAGFTVDCHMIICKYVSLSHKPDYQRSGLNTYQICFTVSMH